MIGERSAGLKRLLEGRGSGLESRGVPSTSRKTAGLATAERSRVNTTQSQQPAAHDGEAATAGRNGRLRESCDR